MCFVLLLAKTHGSEVQCTSVTCLLPGQGNGFIMCAQSFENIDAVENRGSTKCYNFNVLEKVTQKMIGQLPVKAFILFTAKIITM